MLHTQTIPSWSGGPKTSQRASVLSIKGQQQTLALEVNADKTETLGLNTQHRG